MEISFICGPPGANLRLFAERAEQVTGVQFGRPTTWADVESFIPNSESPDPVDIQALVRKPRSEVVALWQEGFRRAAAELVTKQPDIGLLTGHLTLFNADRSEFYSPVSPDLFSPLLPALRQVIIVFDDVFDMYARLAQRHQVFDEYRGVERHMKHAWESIRGQGAPQFSREEVGLLTMEYRIRALNDVLAWRRAEMIQAELLARQLVRPFIPLGIKHSAAVFRPLFDVPADRAHAAYVSHPITRPRQTQIATGEWPPIVATCNRLPERLAEFRVLAVMPTAIDEYRLAAPRGDDLMDRPPLLAARWPLTEDMHGMICAPIHDESDQVFDLDDYPQASGPGKAALSSLVRSLESRIGAEVPFRDHLLVSAVPHLVIFRPMYGTGRFSGGVEGEIRHWAAVADDPSTRRTISFIHHVDDVLEVLASAAESDTRSRTVQVVLNHTRAALAMILKAEHKLERTEEQLDDLISLGVTYNLLDVLPLTEDEARRSVDRALDSAVRYLLVQLLVGEAFQRIGTGRVGMWYVEDDDGLSNDVVAEIVKHLDGTLSEDGRVSETIGIPAWDETVDLTGWARGILGLD